MRRKPYRLNLVAAQWLGGELADGRTTSLSIALGLWGLAFAIIVPLVLLGHVQDVPFRDYMAAGRRWLEHRPLYDLTNIDGFQYLPQAAAIFSLFARMPAPVAAVLWRGLGWAGLATGQLRLARLLMPARADQGFLIASTLTIVQACNALGNGQANLALAALTLHATASIVQRRAWSASAILGFGFALKPLMLVPLLLVVALYKQTRWRVALWLGLFALLPGMLGGLDYAWDQYAACALKLRRCAEPDRLFEDLRSLLCTLGVAWPDSTYFALRVAAALAVLYFGLRIRDRAPQALSTTISIALALGYLMLFNPRTLTTSYVMTTSVGALLAAAWLLQGRRYAAALSAACVLSWHLNHHLVASIEHWFHPLVCTIFCAQLIVLGLRLPRRPLVAAA